MILLDEIDRLDMSDWFKEFIKQKGFDHHIFNLQDTHIPVQELSIDYVIDSFAQLDSAVQNRIRHELFELEAKEGDLTKFLNEFARSIINLQIGEC
ncbi:MAG: hypothetical protein ACFFCM_15435 [Promethearchaeota archaeon]